MNYPMNYRVTRTLTIGDLTSTVTFEAFDRATVDDQLERWMQRQEEVIHSPARIDKARARAHREGGR
jgi:hypothetical protein